MYTGNLPHHNEQVSYILQRCPVSKALNSCNQSLGNNRGIHNLKLFILTFSGADIKSATLTPRLVLYPPQETMTKSAGQKRDLSAFQFSKNFSPISVWSVPPPSLMEATPQQGSNLPSPPRTSPDQQVKFCLDETCDPIGPPKRRRLSAFDDLTKIKTSQSLKPRAASTSSPWTPLFKSDTLSPFLCLDSLNQDVFENDTSDEDDLEGVRDEQTLARSLRKIAKAFENDSSWTSWKARNPFNVI